MLQVHLAKDTAYEADAKEFFEMEDDTESTFFYCEHEYSTAFGVQTSDGEYHSVRFDECFYSDSKEEFEEFMKDNTHEV